MTKKISIICPLYKGQKYVKKVVYMIEENQINLSEEYGIELIFVNDFPEEEIVISNNHIISNIYIIVNKKNVGIHQSRVNGLLFSTGQYILFLDQDDEISPLFLNNQIEWMLNEGCDAVICNGTWRTSKRIYESLVQQEEVVLKRTYFPYIVSPGQVLLKRDAIPKVWTENILACNGCDDALLWNLMLFFHKRMTCNPECLYFHTEGVENASCNWLGMYQSLQECCTVYEQINTDVSDKEYIGIKEKKLETYKLYMRLSQMLEDAENKSMMGITNNEIRQFKSVAVYGYGYLGQRLCKLLDKIGCNVVYVVDQDKYKYTSQNSRVIYLPEEQLPACDLFVITPMIEFDKINATLKDKVDGKIMSIEVILEKYL